jgi:hypothetical protein
MMNGKVIIASLFVAIFGGVSIGAISTAIYWAFDGRTNVIEATLVGLTAFMFAAIAVAAAVAMYDPKHKMREVAHPIAVGRSGRPEISDPLPGPARVQTPASGAHVSRLSKKRGSR